MSSFCVIIHVILSSGLHNGVPFPSYTKSLHWYRCNFILSKNYKMSDSFSDSEKWLRDTIDKEYVNYQKYSIYEKVSYHLLLYELLSLKRKFLFLGFTSLFVRLKINCKAVIFCITFISRFNKTFYNFLLFANETLQ